MQWALLVVGLMWLVAARIAAEHAAFGFAGTLHLVALVPLLTESFFLFLLLGGFTALHWIATREGGVRSVNGLPERTTTKREWLTGLAVGWCMLLAAVLPMGLAGDLHLDFWFAARAWGIALLSVLALAAGSLAMEVAFRGYLFRRLSLATGPTVATLVMATGFAMLVSFQFGGGRLGFTFTLLEGVLFALAYHRTHGIWLGWGLRFGWSAAMGILFGLPVRGSTDFTSLVATRASGANWLTGGSFGPDGSVCGIIVTLAALAVIYVVTKDYAWNYTHEPIVPAGYAVVVQPPAAHTAMEQSSAAVPVSLVQIAAVTPVAPSTAPEIQEYLREKAD